MRRDVLEEFAEAQAMAPQHPYEAGIAEPMESIQRAYRTRRRMLGLCRSCARRAEPNRASCAEHLHRARLRAYASQERSDT